MTAPLPMTTGRRVALLLGLPVALAVIGWTGLTAVAYAGQASYPVRLAIPVHGSTVRLSGGEANVRVTQAAGSQLQVTGTAYYSLIRSTVTWRTTPSGVVVSPRCHFVTGNCSFDLHAVVPAGKRALISNGSGNVTLANLTGPVSAGTGSGDVSGNAVSGANAAFETGSGDISIAGLASAKVTASSGSGDITLTFTEVPAHVRVSTGSGDVSLVLPRGNTLYRVNAATDSGGRVVTVPTSSASQHVITVSAGSGDISITN
jgi:DUF4097 and DUF4098 domain-containing protein YvlB